MPGTDAVLMHWQDDSRNLTGVEILSTAILPKLSQHVDAMWSACLVSFGNMSEIGGTIEPHANMSITLRKGVVMAPLFHFPYLPLHMADLWST